MTNVPEVGNSEEILSAIKIDGDADHSHRGLCLGKLRCIDDATSSMRARDPHRCRLCAAVSLAGHSASRQRSAARHGDAATLRIVTSRATLNGPG